MVLLGFIDEPKGGKTDYDDDPSNWTISRIGGQPAYPSEEISTKLKSSLQCGQCQTEQIFVCQLYCPLEGHKYDRTLYLFACRNPSCWNRSTSWTVIRCQKFDETVEESNHIDDESVVIPSVLSTDWCADADAWNSDDDDKNNKTEKKISPVVIKAKEEVEKKPEIILSAMTIEDENEKSSSDDDEIDIKAKPKSKEKPPAVASLDAFNEWKKANLTKPTLNISNNASFPFYYIVIDDEQVIVDDAKLNEKKKLKNKVKQLHDIDEDGDDEDDTIRNGKEKYENTPDIEHGDVVFYRFQQKIRYAPDQIIRYDWSGQPLIITKLDTANVSTTQKCRHCQSPCVFEFQLMPALVNFLKIDNQIGLEFGVVFVYTCSTNCWNNNNDLYRFENVFVQADPDQNLFD